MAVTLGPSCAPPSPSDEEATGKAGSAITSPPILLGSNATGAMQAAATGTMGLVAWRTATGIDAQRVDASGAAVGSVLSFTTNQWSTSVAVAAGNGTFAVATTCPTALANRPCARRIAADGTLIDATWVIDDPVVAGWADVPGVGMAFNGSDFVLDYGYSSCWSWPDHCTGYVTSTTFATSGPLVFGSGGGLSVAGGFAYQMTSGGGVVCSGPTCAHYYWVGECDSLNCFNPTPSGVYRRLAGTVQLLTAGSIPNSTAASDSMFFASYPAAEGLAAQRMDLAGNPIGGLIPLPAGSVTRVTSTFDGMDFAIAWLSGGDVQANWVSPAGAVALAAPDPAVVTPGTETALLLASFGGGLSLLATLQGSDVEARILNQGCGGCDDDGEPCTIESCDLPTLTCVHTPAPDGKPCPTGACQSGLCVAAPLGAPCAAAAVCLSGHCSDGVCCATACDAGPCDACSMAAGASVDGTCDLLTGNACEDGSACSQDDSCLAGVCVGGAPVVCPAADDCHAGMCDPVDGSCSNVAGPDGSPCDDGDVCSQSDTCQAGVCAGGGPVVCPSAGDCYEAGVCDPADGTCSYHGKPDGTPCPAGICYGDTCFEGGAGGGNTTASTGGSDTGGATAGAGGGGAGGSSEEPSSSGGGSGCQWGMGTSSKEGAFGIALGLLLLATRSASRKKGHNVCL